MCIRDRIGFEDLGVTEEQAHEIAACGQVLGDYKRTPRVATLEEMDEMLMRLSLIHILTSIPWAAGGGVLIGVIENIGTAFLPNSYRDVFAFLFLFSVWLLRPEGLSKKKGIRP